MSDAIDIIKEQIGSLRASMETLMSERETVAEESRSAIDTRLKGLEDQFEAFEDVRKRCERMSLPGVDVGQRGEKEKFSYGRMAKIVCGRFNKDDKEYGYEMQVFKDMQERFEDLPMEMKTAINAATDAGGAFLIPHEVMADIIPELEAISIAAQLGVTRIDGLTGNVTWTKDEGGITASYIDTELEETGAEVVPTFSAVEIRPHVLAAFVPLTYGMLTQPAIALESWVRSRIATKIALRKDLSIFLGDSSNSEPRGIVNVSGIGSFDWTASLTSVKFGRNASTTQNISQGLRSHLQVLANADAMAGAQKLGWAMSPDSTFAIADTVDNEGKPLFIGPNDGVVQNLLGFPVGMSTQLDQSDETDEFILFGDFSKVIDANWGTMAFASSSETETNFRKLRTTVRAVMAHDVALLHDQAMVQSSNFDTTSTA